VFSNDQISRTLFVSHFGHHFDEADVRGMCGIAESTKDLTAIGRFGIGFKSVYQFTDHPQVHFWAEDFTIETDTRNVNSIVPAGDRGDPGSVDGGSPGRYVRKCEPIDEGVRHVTLIGQKVGEIEVDETWLLFSRALTTDEGRHGGYVEIAFSLLKEEKSQRDGIQRVGRSALLAFFPTVLETHLGFLVQGPYPRHRFDCVLGDRGYDAETIQQGLRDQRHHPFSCEAQHRTWQRTGAMALGGGANLRLVESVPATARALRKAGRHSRGLSVPGMCSDLLALFASE
jgi:hypothetical protein